MEDTDTLRDTSDGDTHGHGELREEKERAGSSSKQATSAYMADNNSHQHARSGSNSTTDTLQSSSYADAHARPPFLRASLSASDAGSLSLHASQRMQSTPSRAKQTTTTSTPGSARAGALRVYRNPRPVSSSGTDESSVSLSSEDVPGAREQDEEYLPDHLPTRDFWSSLAVHVDSALMPPFSAASHAAPSTGSSTLVDHDHAAIHSDNARRASPPKHDLRAYTVQSVAQQAESSRTSPPPQSHVSPFAAAALYASEHAEESASIDRSRDRSITPQQQSYRGSASTISAPGIEGDSEIASRVHDIFRRHIHEASTSYALRRSSGANITATASTARPQHRLRDLLASSVNSSNTTEQSYAPSASRRRRIEPRTSAVSRFNARHSIQAQEDSSVVSHERRAQTYAPSTIRAPWLGDSQQPIEQPPFGYAPRQHDPSEHHQTEQSRNMSAFLSRLSQEWRELSARAADVELLQQRSMALASHAETETTEEELNDGDVEDLQPEAGTSIRRTPMRNRLVGSSSFQSHAPATPKVTEQAKASEAKRPAKEEGDDSSSFSPSLVDLPSEEESFAVDSYMQTPGLRITSPAKSNRSVATPEHDRTIPAGSPSRSDAVQSPSNSRVKTPPKTPRFPGHYLSTTPFAPSIAIADTSSKSPSKRQSDEGETDTTSLSASRSRLFSNTTFAMPGIPGGYTSPFPHPKKWIGSVEEEPPAMHVQLHALDTMHKKPDRFSSMLQQIIEEDKQDGMAQAMPSTPTRRRLASSPTSSPPRAQNGQSPARLARGTSPALEPSTVVANNGTASPRSPSRLRRSTMGAESPAVGANQSVANTSADLQGLLFDLVKPVQALLGVEQKGLQDSRNPEDLSADATFVDGQLSRGSVGRKSSNDAMLKQLQEADVLDQSLAAKLEDIQKAFNDMSSQFTMQVTSVLDDGFAKEGRRRRWWLVLAVLTELLLVWALFSFANARADLAYQTTYYDPFFPEIYASPFSSAGASAVTAFSEPPSSTDVLVRPTSWLTWPLSPTIPFLRSSSAQSFPDAELPSGIILPVTPAAGLDTPLIRSTHEALPRYLFSSYMHEVVQTARRVYMHLLSLGLGAHEFAHGTLVGSLGDSSSSTWTSSSSHQLYRVPT